MKERINMKYIKKHKISLIAFLAIIMVLTFIALLSVRADKVEQRAQEKAQREQEQADADKKQLSDMADYLDGIGQTVTSNQENLAEASLLQTETEQTLTEVSRNLSQIEENILCVENLVNRQMEKETEQGSEILLSISSLSEIQQETKSQIAGLGTSISSVLADIREENKKDFISAFEKINGLQEEMEKAGENTKEYFNSLDSLVTLLQEENKEQYQELAEALADAKENISQLLDNGFFNMQIQMEADFTALMERLESLHNQVADAENSVASLLQLMDEKDTDRQEEIREAFASVSLSLEQIRADYTDAHMEIGALIRKLEETGSSNHAEMLSALTVMENNMSENSMENLTRITESLQGMEENFSASISSMQTEMSQKFSSLSNEMTQNMSEYNSSMSERLNQLDLNITNQYQNLSNTVNNYDKGQQESLGNLMSTLEKKLQQVFQFVSNGKKKVASALLTKGVSIGKDATFDEIYNGILSIPQELVIGVQEIPGTVSYEQHYHVNKGGGTPHSESVTAGGGCYTVPVYHTHTGDSRSGGGCYTVPIVHNHVDGCYTVTKTVRRVTAHWYTGEGTGHACCAEAFGQNRARFAYVDEVYINDELVSSSSGEGDLGYCCGLCFDRKAAERGFTSTATEIVCGYSEGLNGYKTGCGKNNRTVEAYTPGCGFVDGQIIGAHIVYDRSAASRSQAAAFSMNRMMEEAGTGYAEEDTEAYEETDNGADEKIEIDENIGDGTAAVQTEELEDAEKKDTEEETGNKAEDTGEEETEEMEDIEEIEAGEFMDMETVEDEDGGAEEATDLGSEKPELVGTEDAKDSGKDIT